MPKEKVISKKINDILDEVSLINYDEKPNNTYMVTIRISEWSKYKKLIVRECLKRDDITFTLNAGFGGGLRPGFHTFAFNKRKDLSAITDPQELEKNVNEILGG